MKNKIQGWNPVVARNATSNVYGYHVVKQVRGKLQRYAIYEDASDAAQTTRIARDLNRADAEGLLKVLLACASND